MRFCMTLCVLALATAPAGSAMAEGGSISGVVVSDDGDRKFPFSLRMSAASDSGGGKGVDVGDDGTFRVDGLAPGRYHFDFMDPMHVPRFFEILRVEVGGRRVDAVEVGEGAEVTGVTVVYARGASYLGATIDIVNGPLLPSRFVDVVVTARRTDPSAPPGPLRQESVRLPKCEFGFHNLLAVRHEVTVEVRLYVPGKGTLVLARAVEEAAVARDEVTRINFRIDAKGGDFGDLVFVRSRPRFRAAGELAFRMRGATWTAAWKPPLYDPSIELSPRAVYGFLLQPLEDGRCRLLAVWQGPKLIWLPDS
jgi:hypothetical protein